MSKQFYLVRKISKHKYLEIAKEAGKPEINGLIDESSEGSMSIGNSQYIAYTGLCEEELVVYLEKEDE